MGTAKTSRRGLKICCGVAAIFIVIIAIVVTTLALTIFKPKNPEITVYPQAEVPIEQSLVQGHGKLNISTSADIMVDRLISNISFWADVFAGSVNFTTDATVHGKVTVVKILKLHASVPSR
ncbi:hypothetical protein REPUB_Repub01dG0039600 [Reevesia pubescens]